MNDIDVFNPKNKDAGYRGMYNMGAVELRRIKGITNPRQTPFDFMGKRELAANLFRVTETEGRIRDKTDIKGQEALENVAYKVGREVRNIMEVKPEVLAHDVVNNIKEVQSNIKRTSKSLAKLDSKKDVKKPQQRKKI